MSQKVLIIKDSNNFYESLKTELENAGYDVVVFDDGEEVLRVINDYEPQIIILFALQNKISGYYLIKEKVEMINAKNIPIMIVTSTERQSEIEGAIHFGAINCILKGDFSAEEVVKNINEYFKNHNLGINISKNNMENKTIKEISEESGKNGIRVLLVEDDEFLRDICKRKLDLEGFNVSVAVDGNEALKKINEEDPQVVLLDVILPGMDGFEVLKNVKDNPSKSNIAIIMLTNLGQESDIEKGLKLGADEYIVKAHFTISEIIQKIKIVLKNKKLS